VIELAKSRVSFTTEPSLQSIPKKYQPFW